jgi:hypothetical protein
MMKISPCLTAGLLLLSRMAHAQVVPPPRGSGSAPTYPYPPPGGSGGGQSFGGTVVMFIVMGVVFYGGIYLLVRIWDFLKPRR